MWTWISLSIIGAAAVSVAAIFCLVKRRANGFLKAETTLGPESVSPASFAAFQEIFSPAIPANDNIRPTIARGDVVMTYGENLYFIVQVVDGPETWVLPLSEKDWKAKILPRPYPTSEMILVRKASVLDWGSGRS